MRREFTYLEIKGTASGFGLTGSDWFMFAPDGIKKTNQTDSEEAFDTFFEWKETGYFKSIVMEHVTYSYGPDQDPYEVPLYMAQNIERHAVADYVEGGIGVYL